ncbi:MAG: hypothetical protein NZ704_07215, partial [Geminicoccaceae bacterium]|nr:hypothetical protein [Geminicoccaceae bacterium]
MFYGVVSVPATPSVSPALWQPEQLVDLCDTVFRAETLRLAESVVPAVVTFTLSSVEAEPLDSWLLCSFAELVDPTAVAVRNAARASDRPAVT